MQILFLRLGEWRWGRWLTGDLQTVNTKKKTIIQQATVNSEYPQNNE